ncbi:MAG: hypothetical protein IKV76_03815 [Clostridia bacterium]|nr:hypothetical protein [Clostridia bacterium]
MKKMQIDIDRYEYINKDNAKYLIYVIPEDGLIEFYIVKFGYGNLTNVCGLDADNPPDSMEEFILKNIAHWIEIAEYFIDDDDNLI